MSEKDKIEKIHTSIRIDNYLYKKVKSEADRRKRSVSFIINEKIRKAYEKNRG